MIAKYSSGIKFINPDFSTPKGCTKLLQDSLIFSQKKRGIFILGNTCISAGEFDISAASFEIAEKQNENKNILVKRLWNKQQKRENDLLSQWEPPDIPVQKQALAEELCVSTIQPKDLEKACASFIASS